MGQQVELSVRSELKKIVEDLERITAASKSVHENLGKMGEQVGENVNETTKRTETYLARLRGLSGRVANQLRGDFRTLLSLGALKESMNLSSQFAGSVKEALTLSDTIRKLGTTFGIASKDFAGFQAKMMKGLGDIGLSSEVAANTLQGLAETPVRGQENILQYSRTSGELASMSRQQGREGEIAKGIAETIRARGGNVNSVDEMHKVAEDLRRVFNATGKGPADTLAAMKELFTGMSKDFRKSISSGGLANLAAASQVAGPNSTKFLEEYLSKSPIARMAMDAQGFKGVITNNGIDVAKFQRVSKSILGRVGGDPRMAAQTLGLSEDAAEGFIRLAESMDKVKAAQDAMKRSTGNIEEQYRGSLGMAESFKASINKVKQLVASPISWLTQGVTGGLSKASQSTGGALAVTAGGGLLAALLAGWGMKGAGKGLGLGGAGGMAGGLLKAGVVEGLTGRQVQPVYVVNASEISGGGVGGLLGAAGGAAGGKGAMSALLTRGGLYGGALAAGGIAGYYLNEKVVEPAMKGTKAEKAMTDFVGAVATKLGMIPQVVPASRPQRVIVDLNKRDLKVSKQPTRGASF